MRVAALCVGSTNAYSAIPGVEVFDKARDVRTWTGGAPVVAHPPCRAWSVRTRHQARPEPGEAELGLLCAHWLRLDGGVLEQPAHSHLFEAAGLPQPGQRRGALFTIAVDQAWWGLGIRKRTWLCLSGVDPGDLDWPSGAAGLFGWVDHDASGDYRRWQVMSRRQRSVTVPAFARWLVQVARLSARRGELHVDEGRDGGSSRA